MNASKSPITHGYLKGYYGYKNYGDELLALGIIPYLFDRYPLEELVVEVDDVEWFQTRLDRSARFLPNILCKVRLVAKSNRLQVAKYLWLSWRHHIFVGGGEVLAPARGLFHGGGNLLILLSPALLMQRVTLLGGFSRAKTVFDKYVHILLLSMCVKCVCRESISYKYVLSTGRSKSGTELYHDFAHDIVDSPLLSKLTLHDVVSITGRQCPYLLVNATPYVAIDKLTDLVRNTIVSTGCMACVYFAGDKEDKAIYDKLVASCGQVTWTQFDWTQHDISVSMSVIKHAILVVAVRLHVIASAYWQGVPVRHIAYQEKIEKFLSEEGKRSAGRTEGA